MARAKGANAQLLGKTESTYGTPPSGNYAKLPFVSCGLGSEQGLIASDVLGQGRDPLAPSRDVIRVEGDLVVPVDVRNFGHHLLYLLGAPATTGTGPYVHTFVSGASALLSAALELGFTDLGQYFMMGGCVYNSMALDFQRSGHANATFNVIAQGEARSGSTGGGTPTSATFSRFSQFNGAIKRDGSVLANITSGKVNFSNNLEKIETIRSDGKIDGADPGACSLAGEIVARFADTTLLAQAESGGACELEFSYTIDSDTKLVVTAHEVYLPKPKFAVQGPGGVQGTYAWQGARDPILNKMMTVVLGNDVASYS